MFGRFLSVTVTVDVTYGHKIALMIALATNTDVSKWDRHAAQSATTPILISSKRKVQ